MDCGMRMVISKPKTNLFNNAEHQSETTRSGETSKRNNLLCEDYAAVDYDGLSGHVIAVLACEEAHCR
jgi:hypothetical protein